jgi:hypothetical protein
MNVSRETKLMEQHIRESACNPYITSHAPELKAVIARVSYNKMQDALTRIGYTYTTSAAEWRAAGLTKLQAECIVASITMRLETCGQYLGIVVIDHVIIGRGGRYESMRARGYLKPSQENAP